MKRATDFRPRPPVRAWGIVERVLPAHRCTVRMPNGFRADAHPDRPVRGTPPPLEAGDSVFLEFSTYDLGTPRILDTRPARSSSESPVPPPFPP